MDGYLPAHYDISYTSISPGYRRGPGAPENKLSFSVLPPRQMGTNRRWLSPLPLSKPVTKASGYYVYIYSSVTVTLASARCLLLQVSTGFLPSAMG